MSCPGISALTAAGESSRSAKTEWRTTHLPRILTAFIVIGSTLGLLCLRITNYDDSALLMGARLTQIGRLPYVDFYTHYGPLGFTFLVPFLHFFPPPLALRMCQALLVAALAVLCHLVARRTDSARETYVPLAVLALSAAAQLPSFLAFSFAFATLGFAAVAQAARSIRAGRLFTLAGGASLAAAGLTRPAFGAYAFGSLVLFFLIDTAPQTRRRLGLLSLAALAVAGVLWITLYRQLGLAMAFEAAVLTPARLVGGGARYIDPEFALPGTGVTGVLRLVAAALAGITVGIAPIGWLTSLPGRVSKAGIGAFLVVSGLGPLVLLGSDQPGRDSTLIALILWSIVIWATAHDRFAILNSLALRAAALYGVTAVLFLHYFWGRPDFAHLAPSLALAAFAACLTAHRVRAPIRVIVAAAFLFAFLWTPHGRWTSLPLSRLWSGGLSRVVQNLKQPGASLRTVWPVLEVPGDAAAAVAFADRNSAPTSRFVAVGSTQAWTSVNPVLLFLLSARPPYTKWYTYDPGLQSSPEIQKAMVRDLEASGSSTAVVWIADQLGVDRKSVDTSARSPFDHAFDALYPIPAARFGNYVVRVRKESP